MVEIKREPPKPKPTSLSQTKLNFKVIKTMKFDKVVTTVVLFQSLLLNNKSFKKMIVSSDMIEKTRLWFKIIHYNNESLTFDANNPSHIKDIRHHIKTILSDMDIKLRYLSEGNTTYESKSDSTVSGKMIFTANNNFFKYQTDKRSELPSYSIQHLQDESKKIDVDYNMKLYDSKKLLKILEKVTNGEAIDKRTIKNYRNTLLLSDRQFGRKPLYTPFYNVAFGMYLTDDNKVKMNSNQYEIEENVKGSQYFITTNLKKRVKLNIYKYTVKRFERVVPLSITDVKLFLQSQREIQKNSYLQYKWSKTMNPVMVELRTITGGIRRAIDWRCVLIQLLDINENTISTPTADEICIQKLKIKYKNETIGVLKKLEYFGHLTDIKSEPIQSVTILRAYNIKMNKNTEKLLHLSSYTKTKLECITDYISFKTELLTRPNY
jgi:hypothetical protein